MKLGRVIAKSALAVLFVACLCAPARGQEPPPAPAPSQEPAPPAPAPAAAQEQKPPSSDPDAKPKSDQPAKPPGTVDAEPASPRVATDKNEIYDPYHAAKSIEVGKYYMRKGDTDAAIERFKDAIHYKFDFAEPRILLAHAYEKKHEDAEAIRYYKEYLKILPSGPDAKHARERIEKLSTRLAAKD